MSVLIEQYWAKYGMKKRAADREKSILEGIGSDLGNLSMQEGNGIAIAQISPLFACIFTQFRVHVICRTCPCRNRRDEAIFKIHSEVFHLPNR